MIGSLFSGIGGLELGLEWAGLGPTRWQVERDPYCRAVLARHWPQAERFDDVRTVGSSVLAPVDGLCGGFPCQDISGANPRGKGLDGARSGLWFEYRRIVDELRPRWVVVENVGRLARRGLDVVASGLHDLGYAVEATRLLAADVGAPHLRERCFIVGIPLGDPDRPRHTLVSGSGGGERDERAPAHRAGPEGAAPEPRVGRVPDGLPWWVDGSGPDGAWPHPRGTAGAPWEPPRTLAGVPMRSHRLRALGNAVVPQCAYVVGLRVRERLDALARRALVAALEAAP